MIPFVSKTPGAEIYSQCGYQIRNQHQETLATRLSMMILRVALDHDNHPQRCIEKVTSQKERAR